MRKSFAVLLVVVGIAASAPLAHAQTGLSAMSADRRSFSVQVRDANTGELSGSTSTSQAGQFSFAALQPGKHVVEIADAAGKVVGLSPSVTIAAGSVVTVTVGASAAGALATGSGGGNLLGLGPLASVAVAGEASAPSTSSVIATGTGKLIVCHPTSATSSQTLQINESAREIHVGHGDSLGACAPRR
jgi:hypothetical protein